MSAFTARPGVVLSIAALAIVVLAAGLAITRDALRRPSARAAAWTIAIASVTAADRLTAHEAPGVRMVAIILVLLYAMKAVVTLDSGARLPALRWLAFAAAWPGMRPGLFARRGVHGGAAELAGKGLVRIIAGALLFGLARLAARDGHPRIAVAFALPALSLILHFGVFNLAAAAWRRAGFPVEPLFRAPARATSLHEFWGRRWNLGFSEMTATSIYRPLLGAVGASVALLVAFLFSGAVHELVITVPAGAGYGLPFLYFALHGALMLLESRLGIARQPVLGRAWTLFWLLAPLPILFPRPFLEAVVLPLVGWR